MAPTSGILNVTPFSKTMFSWFGKTGNVGKESRFEKTPSGMIEDPLAANQEINLFPDGVRSDIGRNIALLDYFDWLGALREKYIDHLTDNMESYPPLVKHYGFLLKGADTDRDTVRQVISQLTTDEIKYRKDDEGLPDPDTAFLPMKQKLYFRTQDKGGRKSIIRCDLDEEMREHGYQRRHVPLYDLNGVEIPLENVNLARGDIISVESNITCALYEVGGKPGARLRRNIRSVVRLRHDMDAEISDSAESPFKF